MIRNIHLTLKYWSDWLCAVVWRKLFCHHSNGALKLMKFGFLSLEGFMDWKDDSKNYIEDGKIIPILKKFVIARSLLHGYYMFDITWPFLLSLGRPLNQIRGETKWKHKKETKLCLSIFSCLFEKKLFFIHLTIKWYPFSLFLSQIFFFASLRGKHKAEESSILSRPKKE